MRGEKGTEHDGDAEVDRRGQLGALSAAEREDGGGGGLKAEIFKKKGGEEDVMKF